MKIATLLPFIILIGAMLLMTRSAKKKQAAAAHMRNDMQPGSGVRTIGGMYATVKEIHADMVLLEVAPGIHASYARNAISAVLDDEEYNRIVNGEDADALDPVVPDDASSLTGADDALDDVKIDLGKKPAIDDAEPKDAAPEDDVAADAEPESVKTGAVPEEAKADRESKDGKTDGEAGAK